MQENENISTYPEEPTNPNDYEGFEKSVYYIFNLLRLMYYSKVESENKFYSKLGGVIGGNVTIQGNLVVNGVNYAIDTTHLNVGDYTITLAKDNEQTLTSMVGMVVPKYDGTNYGFFGWDADGYAYVGDLTNYDGTSNITLANNSSLQKIATIDTTNTVVASNGVIYVYDATSHCFKKPTVDNKYYVIRNGEFVESELFSSEEKSNISKSLYNLGAFDTISGNTITRQTGYAIFDGSDDENWQGWDADQFRIEVPNLIQAADSTGLVCSNRYEEGSNWSAQQRIGIFNVGGNAAYKIFVRDNNYTLTTFKESLRTNPLIVQYKLATSYTESIIPNQPLLNLDSNGCNFLREEYEKGLNLIDENIVKVNDYQINLGKVKLKAGIRYNMQLSNAVAGSQIAVNGTVIAHSAWSYHGYGTENFGVLNDVEGTLQLLGTFTSTTTPTWAMIVEGTTTYPYQEYNGAIVREKDIEPVLLWENSSPNSAFASGNITLSQDRTNFKSLTIWCKLYKDVGYGSYAITIDTINSYYHLTLAYGNSNGNQLNCRGMQPTSNTVLSFADNYNGGQIDNDRLIPIRIFGNKI